VEWTGSSADSYGLFQYVNSNYVIGAARIVVTYNNSVEGDSQWQQAIDSRPIPFGPPPSVWPSFRKNVSVPVFRTCGLEADVHAKADAQLRLLLNFVPIPVLQVHNENRQTFFQGSCAPAPSQYSEVGGGGDCGWFVLQMQDYAGSWYDVGEPFQVCGDYQEAAMSRRKTDITSKSPKVKIHFRADGPLEQRAVGFVQSDKAGAAALVIVDTTRANAEDIEATLLAVARYVALNEAGLRIPIYKNDLGPRARERAKGNSADLLKSLRAAATTAGIKRIKGELVAELELPMIVVNQKH
jgi:hypothetical protein